MGKSEVIKTFDFSCTISLSISDKTKSFQIKIDIEYIKEMIFLFSFTFFSYSIMHKIQCLLLWELVIDLQPALSYIFPEY